MDAPRTLRQNYPSVKIGVNRLKLARVLEAPLNTWHTNSDVKYESVKHLHGVGGYNFTVDLSFDVLRSHKLTH